MKYRTGVVGVVFERAGARCSADASAFWEHSGKFVAVKHSLQQALGCFTRVRLEFTVMDRHGGHGAASVTPTALIAFQTGKFWGRFQKAATACTVVKEICKHYVCALRCLCAASMWCRYPARGGLSG
jgi:hypothetical protein